MNDAIPDASQQSTLTIERDDPPPPYAIDTASSSRGHVHIRSGLRPNRGPHDLWYSRRHVIIITSITFSSLLFAIMFLLIVLYMNRGHEKSYDDRHNNRSEGQPCLEASPSPVTVLAIAHRSEAKQQRADHWPGDHNFRLTQHTEEMPNSERIARPSTQAWHHNREIHTAFLHIPGLYFVPVSAPSAQWTLMLQQKSPSESLTTPVEKSTLQQRAAEYSADPQENLPELDASSADDAGNNTTPQLKASITSFDHLGFEILYPLHRRNFWDMQIGKKWCINTACGDFHALNRTCAGGKTRDRFEQQECKWCWDNSTKQIHHDDNAIEAHCEVVSQRYFLVLIFVCGVFAFTLLVIMASLGSKWLNNRQKLKAARKSVNPESGGPLETGVFVVQNTAKRTKLPKRQSRRFHPANVRKFMNANSQNERVPVIPHAVPQTIDEDIFSGIHNMGQGRLLQDSNSQAERFGLPRTSSRRAISSGSEPIPLGVMNRKIAGGSHEEDGVRPGEPS